jgi:hypothetical protein
MDARQATYFPINDYDYDRLVTRIGVLKRLVGSGSTRIWVPGYSLHSNKLMYTPDWSLGNWYIKRRGVQRGTRAIHPVLSSNSFKYIYSQILVSKARIVSCTGRPP